MGQSSADLAKQPKPFAPLRRLLKLGQPLGHLVDGPRQIADLVIAPRQRDGTEITTGDPPCPPFQLSDAPAQALPQSDGQSQRRYPHGSSQAEKWPNRL